jgi:hypothetical protein
VILNKKAEWIFKLDFKRVFSFLLFHAFDIGITKYEDAITVKKYSQKEDDLFSIALI